MSEDMKLLTANLVNFTPAGRLFVQGRTYFLIANCDRARDNWEMKGGRYIVVPTNELASKSKTDNGRPVYLWARHLTVFEDCLIEWGSPTRSIQCLPAPGTEED